MSPERGSEGQARAPRRAGGAGSGARASGHRPRTGDRVGGRPRHRDPRHPTGARCARRTGLVDRGRAGGTGRARAPRLWRRSVVVSVQGARHRLCRRTSRPRGRSRRRTGGCAARRSRRSTGRSSTHRCGAGTVATYFWLGGMASGSAFVALACDAAGDHRSAAIARKVALGVVAPGAGPADRRSRPPRAIPEHDEDLQATLADEHGRVVPGRLQRLGRAGGRGGPDRAPEGRPRAGCADRAARQLPRLLHRRAARLHRGPAVVAQPHRSSGRRSSPPRPPPGRPPRASRSWRAACRTSHPTRRALGTIETASMLTELSISALGERRLGDAAEALAQRAPGPLLPCRQDARRARHLAPAGRAPHRSA